MLVVGLAPVGTAALALGNQALLRHQGATTDDTTPSERALEVVTSPSVLPTQVSDGKFSV